MSVSRSTSRSWAYGDRDEVTSRVRPDGALVSRLWPPRDWPGRSSGPCATNEVAAAFDDELTVGFAELIFFLLGVEGFAWSSRALLGGGGLDLRRVLRQRDVGVQDVEEERRFAIGSFGVRAGAETREKRAFCSASEER